jgi:hypothetical protein
VTSTHSPLNSVLITIYAIAHRDDANCHIANAPNAIGFSNTAAKRGIQSDHLPPSLATLETNNSLAIDSKQFSRERNMK